MSQHEKWTSIMAVATPQRLFLGSVSLLAAVVAIHALRYFTSAESQSPDILANPYALPLLYVHIAGAATALILGAAGLITALSRRHPLHRWIGRTYVIACIIGGASGFVTAFGSTAGPVATAGFGTLSLLWIYVNVKGWRLALARQFAEHSRWMMRSYALTFAAVTLRLGLPVAPALGFEFVDGYRALSFLSWLINLAVVEAYFSWQRGRSAGCGTARQWKVAA